MWHVSEDASLERFAPRRTASSPADRLVWAVDTRHLPLFWFPRDCPRGTFWAGPDTTDDDVERFLYGDRSRRVHVIESAWLDRLRGARVFAYRMPESTFAPHPEVGGYWCSREPVLAIERVELGDLLARHATSGIELRIGPEIWRLWDRIVASSLPFSGIRLRNAAPRAEIAGEGG